ncbi:MAG: ABC transporter substrate-binding protein [Thermoleophilia bacterium]
MSARRQCGVVAVVASLALAAAAGAALHGNAATTTLVFGTSADPVTLDGALISDGESGRPVGLIFQGLVSLEPGSTRIVPQLATSWSTSKNGLNWTFNLRSGVEFQDGTPFNARAVCFNFTRRYSFPGPLQSDYWRAVFGGFRYPVAGSPGPDKSLYRGCKAVGANKAIILLNRRSGGFLGALVGGQFGIASPEALVKYKADEGTISAGGSFRPTGTFGSEHPIGTGPYMLESWKVGDKLVLVKNPTYWGNAKSPNWSQAGKIDRLVFRAIADNTARLQALQTGEINGYDNVAPQDVPTVRTSRSLRIVNRPPFNVAYVGINQAKPPMDNPLVRQAVAYGLDRSAVVNALYGGRGQTTNQFLPPQLFGSAGKGVPSYPYNPEKAKQLLRQAGLTLPVKIDFWFPTDVSRPYMPDPSANFRIFQAGLVKSGFEVIAHSAPWRPDYLGTVQSGGAQLFLLGWTGSYGDPRDFLNVHFGVKKEQFGFDNPSLFALLAKADAETDLTRRTALYQAASIAVMKFLPVVPYVHSTPALAFRSNVKGFIASPVGLDPFWLLTLG